jgi:hypothetical protein
VSLKVFFRAPLQLEQEFYGHQAVTMNLLPEIEKAVQSGKNSHSALNAARFLCFKKFKAE